MLPYNDPKYILNQQNLPGTSPQHDINSNNSNPLNSNAILNTSTPGALSQNLSPMSPLSTINQSIAIVQQPIVALRPYESGWPFQSSLPQVLQASEWNPSFTPQWTSSAPLSSQIPSQHRVVSALDPSIAWQQQFIPHGNRFQQNDVPPFPPLDFNASGWSSAPNDDIFGSSNPNLGNVSNSRPTMPAAISSFGTPTIPRQPSSALAQAMQITRPDAPSIIKRRRSLPIYASSHTSGDAEIPNPDPRVMYQVPTNQLSHTVSPSLFQAPSGIPSSSFSVPLIADPFIPFPSSGSTGLPTSVVPSVNTSLAEEPPPTVLSTGRVDVNDGFLSRPVIVRTSASPRDSDGSDVANRMQARRSSSGYHF